MFPKGLRIFFSWAQKKPRAKEQENKKSRRGWPRRDAQTCRVPVESPARSFFCYLCVPPKKSYVVIGRIFFHSSHNKVALFFPLGALCPPARNFFSLSGRKNRASRRGLCAIFFCKAKKRFLAVQRKKVSTFVFPIFSLYPFVRIFLSFSFRGSLVFCLVQDWATKRRARGRPAQSRSGGRRRRCRVARGRRGP